jgi:hypothetical protein
MERAARVRALLAALAFASFAPLAPAQVVNSHAIDIPD